MVDLTNLFTQIITPFTGDSSLKLPENPFSASKDKLNFADYRNLNNDTDKYVSAEQQKIMQGLLDTAKKEAGADKEKQASDLYQGLLALKGNGEKYAINSKEFLQNFNALINQVKDDPTLVNELRKSLVTNFGKLSDEQRNLNNKDAKNEWYEISYESSLDKLKTLDTTISSKLEDLSKLDPKKEADKKKVDSFITSINKDFGDVAKFNELLNDAGIKYKIDGSLEKGYSIKSTDTNKTSAMDPKSTKAIQKETLEIWEKNAEFINNLDTSKFKINKKDFEFKTDNGKKAAQNKITELAQYNNSETYTKEALEENLDLLTKAYKRNLDTGEFSMAELDRARMNLIGKVHKAGKTDKSYYGSEFSDKISKLNTIAFLQSESLRDNAIIPRLANDARANGHINPTTGKQKDDDLNDIKSATGGERSDLWKLINKSSQPKKPEAAEKISTIELKQLKAANYNPENKVISFTGKDSSTANIQLGDFLTSLLANEIKLTDSQGNIIKIEDARKNVKLTKDGDNNIKVTINNSNGNSNSPQEIVFNIPKNELNDKFLDTYTPLGTTLDQLLRDYNGPKK
jgi:hypothetical protein